MCGICGELKFDGTGASLTAINQMNQKLSQRGPDNEGTYQDGPLAFGHRRLAIIDLTERSNQPMVDERLGLVLVFNGAIYNYKVLRAELQQQGYAFFSDGDSEVIIKAFHAWGASCLARLHGMFAFAIWNVKSKELFLARDRLGIKPLYYHLTTTGIRFASSMQALLAAGDVDTRIDPVALHHQLTLHAVIPAPRTILKGIRKLSPAKSMSVNWTGQVSEQRYWTLQATRNTIQSEPEWIDAVHTSLRRAVKRRRDIADVPVGVLLSGGLDSSLLVALLIEAGVSDLKTYSIGFEDVPEEKGSEFEYSDQVVDRYQTEHHQFIIANDDVLKRLPEAIQFMSEPMVGQDAVAFYLLSEQVAKSVKVVQSGQGADEVFAGYFWYAEMQAAVGSDLERFRRYYFDRSHQEFLAGVTAPYRGEDYTSALIEALLAEPGADEFLDKVLRMDVTTLIVDDPVKRVDNMTMAWGLEARVPFLDHEVVELAAQMPPSLKLKAQGKYPLKTIARGLLPAAVIDRPKGYFPMPALKFVRGPFLDFMRDILLSTACRQRGVFEPRYVEKLLNDPESYMTKLNGSKLWHFALLELWFQQHID